MFEIVGETLLEKKIVKEWIVKDKKGNAFLVTKWSHQTGDHGSTYYEEDYNIKPLSSKMAKVSDELVDFVDDYDNLELK